VNYLIQIPDELDHLVRQMCDSREKRQSKAVSPEEFLSAFLEEKLNELFARRERPKTGKNKKVAGAVRSAKERAKTWREAANATQTALEALRKLVAEATMEPKSNPEGKSRQ
jgi:ATP-dependent Clp protease ATP-binding subunit ClpA